MNQVRVLWIAGHGRSGSTLLDRVLGQIDGYCSTGELGFIWENAMVQNERCGCGNSFEDCEFWHEVIREAFGKLDIPQRQYIHHLWSLLIKRKAILKLAFPRLRDKQFSANLTEYVQILDALYRAVQKISSSSVVIDSCGFPPHGYILNEIPAIDLRVIHLIRDSRAVTYSWQTLKKNPSRSTEEAYMERLSTAKSIELWMFDNIFVEILKRKTKNNTLIRYEDFVSDPIVLLKNSLKDIQLPDSDFDFFTSPDTVDLQKSHTVCGNPMRFRDGEVKLKLDERWKSNMPRFKKDVVGAITSPLLLYYYGKML